eukprot:1015667-Prymnesium_polylepis.1
MMCCSGGMRGVWQISEPSMVRAVGRVACRCTAARCCIFTCSNRCRWGQSGRRAIRTCAVP